MEFKENAIVFSAQGDEVGRLERVVLDPYSKEITHLVIRRGALFTEDRVEEEQIHLSVGSNLLEALPEYEE